MEHAELPDEFTDKFVLQFPCFSVRSGTGKGFMYEDIQGGGKAVVLLTDEDLFERYRRDRGLQSHGPIRIENALELLEFLENLPPAITNVAFDATGKAYCPTVKHVQRKAIEHISGAE